jgi:DNA polymerase-3 subunit epsilon
LRFCITDIETTGGRYALHNITEIASIITDGTSILDTYQTLVKPDGNIPRNITLLTGITNEMVSSAPRFEDIAKEWLEFSKDSIFVAHNVGFDLGFIRNQLNALDVDYNPKKLCTVRLSRKIAAGLPSYSLGNLCNSLGIKITDRHRAMGDAKATTTLFHYLIANDKTSIIDQHLKKQQKTFALPPYLDEKEFAKMPLDTGVYYLLDKQKKPLYIGKAKNIKQRVRNHFRTAKRHMLENLYYLDFKLTGTDLLASIIEADEIKKFWPPYNVAQKFPRNTFTLTTYTNQKDELKLAIKRSKSPELSPLFGSQYNTRVYLESWVQEKKLCPRLSGLQFKCLNKKCKCANNKKHNKLLEKVAEEMRNYLPSFCLIDKGRTSQEKSILWINEGKMKGYAYTPELPEMESGTLDGLIEPMKEHPETAAIIGKYLAEYMTSSLQHKQYIAL